MSAGRRAFDLALVVVLLPALVPLAAATALAVLLHDGRPVLHGSERIGARGRPFTLWKFRTMRPGTEDGGVSGGDKASRITPLGRRLRRLRLDELPQLWNVLRGEMALVGPRPPLRRYVDRAPALYARVLQGPPGLTGLATLVFHRREEALLARCNSAEETDAVYARRCVPVKARLDLLHAARRSAALDLLLLWLTVVRVAGVGRGRRWPRQGVPRRAPAARGRARAPRRALLR